MSDISEVYYVILQGARSQPIFNSDDDRRRLTQVVGNAIEACRVRVHAYCWLRTEARLAVQSEEKAVGDFARQVVDSYARRHERETGGAGGRLERRFRGVPVEGQTALLDLVRHIHLAPLKYGLADELDDYVWSSHPVYAGRAEATWLTTEVTLQHLAHADGSKRLTYQEFMQEGLEAYVEVMSPAYAAASPPHRDEPRVAIAAEPGQLAP